jgi:hypothetical protein
MEYVPSAEAEPLPLSDRSADTLHIQNPNFPPALTAVQQFEAFVTNNLAALVTDD